jgi:multimeric flavodoxin WrbA
MEDRGVIAAVLGSPRRHGNSDTLAHEFLKGASSRGYQHRLLILSELGISPCDGGNQCFEDGRCAIRDGMNAVYEMVLSSPYLLIATPIYFMGPPAMLKAFIDRFQAVWARSAILKTFDPDSADRRRNHRAFLIITGATPDKPSMYRPTISIIKAFLNVAGFGYAGDLIAGGLEQAQDAGRHQDLLQKAYAAGRDFVSWKADQ